MILALWLLLPVWVTALALRKPSGSANEFAAAWHAESADPQTTRPLVKQTLHASVNEFGSAWHAETVGDKRTLPSSSSRPLVETSEAKQLCALRRPGGAEPVSLWLLPNNGRAIAFGGSNSTLGSTTETSVNCLGPTPAGCQGKADGGDLPYDNVASCPACPCEVDDSAPLSASNELLYEAIAPMCARALPSRPIDVLMIGLGGGALHQRVVRRCAKGTRVRSVEVDAAVAALATQYFGVDLASGSSEVVVADGGKVVRSLAANMTNSTSYSAALGTAGFDVVVVDSFVGHGHVARECRTPEFIGAVRRILKPGGAVLQHIWHYSPEAASVASEYQKAVAQYKEEFQVGAVNVWQIPRAFKAWDSVVVAISPI